MPIDEVWIQEQQEQRFPEAGGTKYDSGKPDLSLVSLALMQAIARAKGFGAAKYQRYNYLKGFENHRLIAACLRHVLAYQDGEDKDPESGLDHLDHAAACLDMLMDCQAKGTLTDTRFTRTSAKP